jgi:hypothetical protein
MEITNYRQFAHETIVHKRMLAEARRKGRKRADKQRFQSDWKDPIYQEALRERRKKYPNYH